MRIILPLLSLSLALLILGGLALAIRLAWVRGRAAAVELVGDGLAKVVAPAVTVSALELQHRMVRAGLASASVSVTGDRYLPRTTKFEVAADDLHRLATEVEGGLDRARADVAAEIGARALKRGVSLPPGYTIEVFASPFVRAGRPQVGRELPAVVPPPAAPIPTTQPTSTRPAIAPTQTTSTTTSEPAALDRTAIVPGVIPTRAAARRSSAPTRAAVPIASVETKLLDRCELVDLRGGDPVRLSRRVTTVGRGVCDITLTSDLVSQQHAELVCRSGVWRIHDLGSTNGTWLNGSQINDAELISGDRISFGLDGPAFVFARTRADNDGRG